MYLIHPTSSCDVLHFANGENKIRKICIFIIFFKNPVLYKLFSLEDFNYMLLKGNYVSVSILACVAL